MNNIKLDFKLSKIVDKNEEVYNIDIDTRQLNLFAVAVQIHNVYNIIAFFE